MSNQLVPPLDWLLLKTPPRILVVDDDVYVLRGLARLLRERCIVSVAQSGHAALERLCTGGLDFVLVDAAMPDMSGAELLSVAQAHWPGVRRLLTSGGQPMHLDAWLATNLVQAWLPKPMSLAGILAVTAHDVSASMNRATSRGTPR